ncbi:hypothetical protein GGI26_005918 [Coemansia sp. RSA 1358]|nr:hypothetical protein GGI26_005918 [Coemansia sp. RSA 1358]
MDNSSYNTIGDPKHQQPALCEEAVRGMDDKGLSVAIASMCNDFGQQTSRQRTLSWVSSAVSSTGPSVPGDPSTGHTSEAAVENTIPEGAANGLRRSLKKRQHVRLTTIDPITGKITEVIGNSNADGTRLQESLPAYELTECSEAQKTSDNTGTNHADPGYIKNVFIRPNILQVAISGNTRSGKQQQAPQRVTCKQRPRAANNEQAGKEAARAKP